MAREPYSESTHHNKILCQCASLINNYSRVNGQLMIIGMALILRFQ